jgi:HSP20 family protein
MTDINTTSPKERADSGTAERTRGGVTFSPRVDIYETDRELVLLADLPGVKPEDIDLRYEKGELILQGKTQPRHAGKVSLLNEYEVGDFYRVFSIHESIDSTKIEGEVKNGVLTVHLPKMEASRPRQINVKVQ